MPGSSSQFAQMPKQGWEGWDEYAPFYDWENARTLGRRDVAVLARVAAGAGGRCSSSAAARDASRCRSREPASISSASIDRRRCSRGRADRPAQRREVAAAGPRADIRALPFRRDASRHGPRPVRQSCSRSFAIAIWPRRSSRWRACSSPAACSASTWCRTSRTGANIRTGSSCGARPRAARELTLVESVRQDRRRRLTTFEQRYVERRGGQTTDASLRADVPHAVRPADDAAPRAGRILGGNRAGRLPRQPWDARADVWIILAKKV